MDTRRSEQSHCTNHVPIKRDVIFKTIGIHHPYVYSIYCLYVFASY